MHIYSLKFKTILQYKKLPEQAVILQFDAVLYRVTQLCLFFIWLKMTLKCTIQMKTRRFYNHKDPPFDMKYQLMSADPFPVVIIDL